MIKTFGAATLLIAAIAAPVNEARAQDVLGGALLGGAAGAILGGAIGGGRGAAIGAIIGSGTGAVIAVRRPSGATAITITTAAATRSGRTARTSRFTRLTAAGRRATHRRRARWPAMRSPTACSATAPTIRGRAPTWASTASGGPARSARRGDALAAVHPRRQPAKARKGHRQRRRRAAARSRRFDLAGAQGRGARRPPLAFLKEARTAKSRPRLYVRVNGLRHRAHRRRPRRRGGRPSRRHHVSQGRGRRGRDALRRQDHRARGDPRPARRRARHHRDRDRNRAGDLPRRHLRRLEQAAQGPDLGRGGPLGRARRRGEPRRDGNFLDPYRLARSLCLAGAAAAQVQAIDTVYIDFRNEAGFRRECEEARRDGFTGKMLIHPAQVAVCNEVFTPTAEAIKKARSGGRGVRRQSRRRHGRHRRRDVRPAASGAGPAIAGAKQSGLIYVNSRGLPQTIREIPRESLHTAVLIDRVKSGQSKLRD